MRSVSILPRARLTGEKVPARLHTPAAAGLSALHARLHVGLHGCTSVHVLPLYSLSSLRK